MEQSFLQRNKFVYLLLVLLIYFIGLAIITDTQFEYLVAYSSVLLMVLCLYVISGEKRFLFVAGSLLLISLLLATITDFWLKDHSLLLIMRLIFNFLFLMLLFSTTLYYTLSSRTITANNLCGAVCSYLLIGFSWSFLYSLIELSAPGAFNVPIGVGEVRDHSPQFLYYSFVTLTTLGYGDIYPMNDIAKTASWLEAAFGQLFIAVLVAQLVSLYTRKRKQ